jgi:hypothetical protein
MELDLLGFVELKEEDINLGLSDSLRDSLLGIKLLLEQHGPLFCLLAYEPVTKLRPLIRHGGCHSNGIGGMPLGMNRLFSQLLQGNLLVKGGIQ